MKTAVRPEDGRPIRCQGGPRVWLLLILATAALGLSGCFNTRPMASFTISSELRPGIEISFINTSTDPNGIDDITMCSWSFGDGSYADSFNAQHTYEHPGTYTVGLTVYDSNNNASSCSREIDVRSRVFGIPDPTAAVMGRSTATGPECGAYGTCIPPSRRYDKEPSGRNWIVDYMFDQSYMAYVPENLVFWLPVRFAEDLSQSLLLVMSWHLMTQGTEQGLLYYSDPEEYALGSASGITGINAIWDFWGLTEKLYQAYRPYGRYDMLPAGYYKVRLQILDRQSEEKFIWDFPFRVCWGGCR